MSKQCSATTPHAPHTWGGRPMISCEGIGAVNTEQKSEIEHFFDAHAPFHWNKADVLKVMEAWATHRIATLKSSREL